MQLLKPLESKHKDVGPETPFISACYEGLNKAKDNSYILLPVSINLLSSQSWLLDPSPLLLTSPFLYKSQGIFKQES